MFAGEAVRETVTTRLHFRASPQRVWQNMVFFEEVPGQPPILLRLFLPRPVRTEGDKTSVGSRVRCEYTEGELIKRITQVETAKSLHFEVLGQRLGIEECIETLGGSYQMRICGEETDVELATNYRTFLHPRFIWRHVEAILIGQLHRHILRGLSHELQTGNSRMSVPATAESPTQSATRGGMACTVSPSSSRR